MPFYEANAAQLYTFVQPKSESKITHPGSMHNAQVFLDRPPSDRNDWHLRFTSPAVDRVNHVAFRKKEDFQLED